MGGVNFEQAVTTKVDLILRAQHVAPGLRFDPAWPDERIRATAVSHAAGPAAIDGRTPIQIEAMFDHLAERTSVDPVRAALAGRDRSH